MKILSFALDFIVIVGLVFFLWKLNALPLQLLPRWINYMIINRCQASRGAGKPQSVAQEHKMSMGILSDSTVFEDNFEFIKGYWGNKSGLGDGL